LTTTGAGQLTPSAQLRDHIAVALFGKEVKDVRGDDNAHIRHFLQLLNGSLLQRFKRAKIGRQPGCRRFTDFANAQRVEETSKGGLFGFSRALTTFCADFGPMRSSPVSFPAVSGTDPPAYGRTLSQPAGR
jgi:hypothetical protein